MAKKQIPKIKAEAKAVAKVEASVKASYQRKKTITEVIPEDVTRAKASAWLTLISPITQWAGLKGDALEFQRKLLRIQQEETLLRVAQSVRNKLVDVSISKPVARKILVPALEKASLEEADDEVMVDRWASLLASAAQDVKVQPRFVGILEELAGAQAVCLEKVAFNRWEEFNYPSAIFEDSSMLFADHYAQKELGPSLARFMSKEGSGDKKTINSEEDFLQALENAVVYGFCRPGTLLRTCFLSLKGDSAGFYEIYDVVRDTGARDDSDLSILESLGLIRYGAVECEFLVSGFQAEVSLYYWYLTDFGVQFCEVCSSTGLKMLAEKGANSSRHGLPNQRTLWEL
jgi:hypothetical protein